MILGDDADNSQYIVNLFIKQKEQVWIETIYPMLEFTPDALA